MRPSNELSKFLEHVATKAAKARPSELLKLIHIFFAANGPRERRLCRDEVNRRLREVNERLAERVLGKFDIAANAGLGEHGTKFEMKLSALAAKPQEMISMVRPLPVFQNGQAVSHSLTGLTGVVLTCLSAATPEAFRSRHHVYSVSTEHGERRMHECDLTLLSNKHNRGLRVRF